MRLLAIETSTMLGGIAIFDNIQGLIAESRLNVKVAHSERLMTEIDNCLKKASLKITDIDVFSASAGPGSFTGLRIGLSTLKGLAYASGKPVVTVPSLEAMAWNLPFCPMPVCPLFDARKKEIYTAVFLWDTDGFQRLLPETSIDVSALGPHLREFEKVVFLGEGACLYKDDIVKLFGKRAVFAPSHLNVPLPSSTAYLALRAALNGKFENASSLKPFYVRKSEAELKNP